MSKPKSKIFPSVLAADFGRIAEDVKRCEEAGADGLQLDIMDGHFVRNLSFGPAMVAAVNQETDLFLDIHMMIYNPFEYVEQFVEAGADSITIHFEATEDVDDTIDYIHRCNIKAGLAFCPETSESLVLKYLDKVDRILLMTVNPGFGGQAFLPEVLSKIEFVRKMADQLDLDINIQVDGGVNAETTAQCSQKGANEFVVGSWLFKQPSMKDAITQLRGAAL